MLLGSDPGAGRVTQGQGGPAAAAARGRAVRAGTRLFLHRRVAALAGGWPAPPSPSKPAVPSHSGRRQPCGKTRAGQGCRGRGGAVLVAGLLRGRLSKDSHFQGVAGRARAGDTGRGGPGPRSQAVWGPRAPQLDFVASPYCALSSQARLPRAGLVPRRPPARRGV